MPNSLLQAAHAAAREAGANSLEASFRRKGQVGLARRAQSVGLSARRRSLRLPTPDVRVGKGLGDMEDVWRASVGAAKLRNTRNAAMGAQAAARTNQARQATVSTNMLNFKATRKNRFASGIAVGKRAEVEKGIIRQSVAPVQARVNPTATLRPRIPLTAKPVTRAIIGKAGVLETARLVPKALKGGWKLGTGSKLKTGLKDAATLNSSKTLQSIGGASKWAAQNRGAAGLSAGVVGGSVIGAGLARRDDVDKAYGDPEDARYYRLGIGSAALGAGGAAGLGYAAHDARKTSQIARAGSPFGVHAGMKNSILVSIPKEEVERVAGSRKQATAHLINPKAVHRADRLARNGLAITRRGALAGAGGLAALGGAEVLRRRAHERRYN